MTDFPVEDRELLAVQYDKGGPDSRRVAARIRQGDLSYSDECALHALAARKAQMPAVTAEMIEAACQSSLSWQLLSDFSKCALREQMASTLNAALAAAPRPSEPDEWHTIDTAPVDEDGVEFDLLVDGRWRAAECHYHQGEWLKWTYRGCDDEPRWEAVARVTHWKRITGLGNNECGTWHHTDNGILTAMDAYVTNERTPTQTAPSPTPPDPLLAFADAVCRFADRSCPYAGIVADIKAARDELRAGRGAA